MQVSKLNNSGYPLLKCWFNTKDYAEKNRGRVVFGWVIFKE